MTSSLHISASREYGARHPAVESKIKQLEARLNALSDDDLETVIESIAQALEPSGPSAASEAAALFAEDIPESQRVEDELELLTRSFERRRKLLADALTAPQVAKLLSTTRQTPHDRVKAGTLLAVMDRGALRFPSWQFDPDGPDGVVAGLPEVIRALVISPMAKISWLTRPSQMFDGQNPLELLRRGQSERVIRQAQGASADGR